MSRCVGRQNAGTARSPRPSAGPTVTARTAGTAWLIGPRDRRPRRDGHRLPSSVVWSGCGCPDGGGQPGSAIRQIPTSTRRQAMWSTSTSRSSAGSPMAAVTRRWAVQRPEEHPARQDRLLVHPRATRSGAVLPSDTRASPTSGPTGTAIVCSSSEQHAPTRSRWWGRTGPGGFTLYRRGDRLVGAVTIDRRSVIMKFRRRIAERGDWAEALAAAEARVAQAA